MKALLLLCLAAFLAAVTSATRSPWGYVAVMKGKIRYLCDKVDDLEHKVDTCCDQSSGSSKSLIISRRNKVHI